MKSELLQNIFLFFVVGFFIKLHGHRKENSSEIESVVVKPVRYTSVHEDLRLTSRVPFNLTSRDAYMRQDSCSTWSSGQLALSCLF